MSSVAWINGIEANVGMSQKLSCFSILFAASPEGDPATGDVILRSDDIKLGYPNRYPHTGKERQFTTSSVCRCGVRRGPRILHRWRDDREVQSGRLQGRGGTSLETQTLHVQQHLSYKTSLEGSFGNTDRYFRWRRATSLHFAHSLSS